MSATAGYPVGTVFAAVCSCGTRWSGLTREGAEWVVENADTGHHVTVTAERVP